MWVMKDMPNKCCLCRPYLLFYGEQKSYATSTTVVPACERLWLANQRGHDICQPCSKLAEVLGNMPVKLVKTRRFSDDRGWFSETWVDRKWRAMGVDSSFVQDNHSYSGPVNTIRGIHFQTPPHTQVKLVRCIRGRIMDFAVDLRNGSPTYGQHVGAELSAENGYQLFVPGGFGHAFVTLEPNCEVAYKVSDYYAPECESGIRWDCPQIGIDWQLEGRFPALSSKDKALPTLAEFTSIFDYDGNPLEPLEV